MCMKKKILLFLLFFIIGTANVKAADNVVEVNGTQYISLSSALSKIKDSTKTTITFIKDVQGSITIPTESYRDEGTSYHYKEASDYITNTNSNKVAEFIEYKKLPYVLGRNWTTDSFYRETENNLAKRKADGCISVEMECSAMQAVCDFRGLQLYYFLTSGDLLDTPEWDQRHAEGEYAGTQHDTRHFDIAIELAEYISQN